MHPFHSVDCVHHVISLSVFFLSTEVDQRMPTSSSFSYHPLSETKPTHSRCLLISSPLSSSDSGGKLGSASLSVKVAGEVMGRTPCCEKAQVKRGPWSPEEDMILKKYIEDHGTGGNWIALPHKAGLKRCGKSCRLRWLNYLRPDIKHGGFTKEEDDIICGLYNSIGSRWSVIASQLPGRTDNDVKNYWNTKLKKRRMMAMAIAAAQVTTSSNNTASGGTIVDRIDDSPRPPPPSTSPIIIPIEKNETYTCDDFLKPLVPSPPASATTDTGLGGFARYDSPPPVAAAALAGSPRVQINTSGASSLVTVDDGSRYSDWWTIGSGDTDEFLLEFVGSEAPVEFLSSSSDASLFDTETRSQVT